MSVVSITNLWVRKLRHREIKTSGQDQMIAELRFITRDSGIRFHALNSFLLIVLSISKIIIVVINNI